jgi:hypothetical protein
MLVVDLNGRKKPWKLTGYLPTNQDYYNRPRSELHLTARGLLSSIFPTLQILEEVAINVNGQLTLYLDFYLPLVQTAIEVHGQQHYNFVSHFHKTQWDFIVQTQNDKMKQRWCELNNLDLIILPYNESPKEWKERFNSPNE